MEFQELFLRNYKYKEKFTKHVPYQSIALNQFMIELPNLSEKLKKEFLSYLEWSEKSYFRSIEIAKLEAVVYEFDFSITDSLRGLSDVCFLIAEYRERISYKYASFSEQDYERRLNRLIEKKKAEAEGQIENFDLKALKKEIIESGDKWEEMKNDKESLAVFNYKNKACKYLEAAIASAISQSEFLDKQHELSTINLTDAQKIPKELISELYESSQINKIITQKLSDFEFKDKTSIISSELLAYYKSVVYECCMLTFGSEKSRLSKLISKIHRYLITNLSSYAQKCVFTIADFPETTDAFEISKKQICAVSQVNCQWFDFQGRKSQLIYVLGPIDENIIKKSDENEHEMTEQQKQEQIDAKIENQIIYFGKVELNPLTLSTLYQETKDLIEQMKVSEKQSEEKNRRDRKYQRQTYHNLIERFGNIFKPPVISEEELERDVDTLTLVKDLIPELNIDNVSRLAQILQKHQGCSQINPNLNAILRKFHRIRYIK